MKAINPTVAIVVTYNRKELLLECLNSLCSQVEKRMDILVIDNASTDGTEKIVKNFSENHNNIDYVNTGKNLGGAGGFHFGLKEAYRRGYEYMWIMDDDTIPEKEALTELQIADKKLKGKFGFLSSCALWIDGSYCIMNKQLVDQDNCIKEYDKFEAGLIRVSKATFVSLFLKREVLECVGLPLKEYFIWGDDMEYTLRISKKYPCYMVSKSKVIHKMKSNVGSDISMDEKERINRYELAYRNDCHTAWINGAKYIAEYYEFVLYSIKKIVCSKSKYKAKRMWILIKGSMKGLFFRPQVEYLNKGGKR